MKFDFSTNTYEGDVRLDGQVIPKTPFTIWDQRSRMIGISMKMLVIELKSIG
jgi:hypothetical protein